MQFNEHRGHHDLLQKYYQQNNQRNTGQHISKHTKLTKQAAAIDVHIQTKVTPIWEQIRQKKEFFNIDTNRYWDVQKSINIFEEWCNHHNIDAEDFSQKTFEVCHKIRPKINGLHITRVSNSGK